MSVKQVGQTLELDSGTLTPLMKRLEKDGWINRKRSTEDERRVDMSLTKRLWMPAIRFLNMLARAWNWMNLPQSEYDHIKSK